MKKFKELPSYTNSRRSFLKSMSAGSAALAFGSLLQPGEAAAKLFGSDKSEVSFVTGTDRRENIYQSLKPLQKEVEKAIGERKVVIKANAGLLEPQYAICSSHADQLRGILDFLKPIYDRQVIIA